jgi:hypothetical protein
VNANAEKLARAAALMQRALTESTGVKDLQQKLVIYWTLAARSLRNENTFPLLSVQGKMGTGKSQALMIIGNFSFRPVRFSLRGMTGPTIRDKFAEAYNGTAIIEEADSAWMDPEANFERLLSDRYQRASAEASHKVRSGDKNWTAVTKQYFGATALHRRVPFKDAALDGRNICARTRPDHTRQYREFNGEDPWNIEGKQIVSGLTFQPIAVEQPSGIAARVFDTYRPLLSAAKLCEDKAFEEQLQSRLVQATLELKEAQSSEADGLVLQAVIEHIWRFDYADFSNIKFSDLSKRIWENHRLSLTPRQIGPIARELGLTTNISHGVAVVQPSPATLLKACNECDYTDEGIEELRQSMLRA